MADDEELDDELEPSGGSSMVPMIGGMVVMLLVGLGGGYFAAGMMAEEPAAEAAEGEEVADGDAVDLEVGVPERAVHNLGRFTVNLRGTGGARVLRTEVQVEVKTESVEQIDAATPLLRDAVLTLASDYSYQELEGLDGKLRLRDELLGRLNANLAGGPRIERIYFTEFVVQ